MLLLLALAVAVLVQSASAETLAGRVVSVTDGDTLTVLVEGNRQVKVRLAGIDAPKFDEITVLLAMIERCKTKK
ncbi:MAG: hypothetical protein P9F75_00785 [Candidatus Contendobacter sp.]|nr:hypothetical protein [Candidatus Contendobacter sp.]